MRFQVLGPLEVVVDGRSVRLNGIKQRATLGFLLLHQNRVVATSQLLRALWAGEVPATARKMLQNAVSGLRRVLSHGGGASAALVTHAPGYMLRVEPECVDLVRFQRMVECGRAELAAGSWEGASRTLREALALWQGPALTDLVESGIAWPELAAVENARLAALEDCVEAELAYGRHHDVVGELEALLETISPRERLCGHLMLALYRCGRQADALSVYRRTRARLVDGLGLEPGRELRDLERAILNHDPALEFGRARLLDGRPADSSPGRRPAPAARPGARGSNRLLRAGEGHVAEVAVPARERAERRLVSVLLMMAPVAAAVGDDDPEVVDEVRRGVAAIVHEEAEHLGGAMGTVLGPVWSVVFGATRTHEDDAVRAVRAASAVRDRLVLRGFASPAARRAPQPFAAPAESALPQERSAWGSPFPGEHFLGEHFLGEAGEGDAQARSDIAVPVSGFQVAVATGDVLLRWRDGETDSPPAVTGGVFDRCMRLLMLVPPGELRVCDTTRRASDRAITYDRDRELSGGWRVVALEPMRRGRYSVVPFVDRDRELDMLHGLLDQVRRRRRPHLVTVLGEPGIGKSRLVAELGRTVGNRPDAARFLVARTPPYGVGTASAVLGEIARGEAGDVLAPTPAPLGREQPVDNPLAALPGLLADIAAERPLVLVVEDVHRADDTLLDVVEAVTERAGSVPLLLIVTARMELLAHRPGWGGGKYRATTITLDPLSDAAITRLLSSVCAHLSSPGPAAAGAGAAPQPARAAGGMDVAFLAPWFARIGGNPLFAQEYARMIGSGGRTGAASASASESAASASAGRVGAGFGRTGAPDQPRPLPHLVYGMIASRLDTLPAAAKAVLHDAAVLGEPIWTGAVAAVGGWSRSEVVPWLEYLESREFLQRVRLSALAGETQYSFRHVLVRDVTYSQIPRSARADKHRLAAAWLERLQGDHTELLARHRAGAAGARRSSARSQPVSPFDDGLDHAAGAAQGGA